MCRGIELWRGGLLGGNQTLSISFLFNVKLVREGRSNNIARVRISAVAIAVAFADDDACARCPARILLATRWDGAARAYLRLMQASIAAVRGCFDVCCAAALLSCVQKCMMLQRCAAMRT